MFRRLFCLLPTLFFAACSVSQLPPVSQDEFNRLEVKILALGPHVSAEEAARAARVALQYPRQLRSQYEVTDGPLIHNSKVNAGTRPRGLCWHWAQDMQMRLAAEQFETLDLHRAIANSNLALRIDHSTVLISAAGDTMLNAIVLDPWRFGGLLYFGTLVEDTKYKWLPQTEVLRKRAENQL
jgi:hypothetical protein